MGRGQGTIQPRQARRELRAGGDGANRLLGADGFRCGAQRDGGALVYAGNVLRREVAGGPDGKLLAVAHTYQQTESAKVQVRIISAREATRREREQYVNEPR